MQQCLPCNLYPPSPRGRHHRQLQQKPSNFASYIGIRICYTRDCRLANSFLSLLLAVQATKHAVISAVSCAVGYCKPSAAPPSKSSAPQSTC